MDRRVWLLVAAFAALALAFGTGGFSAAEIDRGVTVNVVDDPAEGYVGIEYLADPVTVTYGSNDRQGEDPRHSVHLLTLRNNLDDPVRFTVTVEDPTSAPPKLSGDADSYELGGATGVARGGTVHLSVPVVCAGDTDRETWALQVTADWGGVVGELTRDVTVECEKRAPRTDEPSETPGDSPGGDGEKGDDAKHDRTDAGDGRPT